MKNAKVQRKLSIRILSQLPAFIFFSLLTCILCQQTYATHNLAGQISATYVGSNRYDIQITTYTDPAPAGVDRCTADLEIWNCSGQLVGTIEDIPRANGPLDPSPNPMECPPGVHIGVEVYTTVKRNIYNTSFTFPGQGCYILRYFDLARRKDVTNITDPGNQTFFVETQIFIPNPLLGQNNSPILLNEPLDEACVGKIWTHNPGGFDAEGDSLVYSLLPSLQYDPPQGIISPTPTKNYLFPGDPQFGTSSFSIDSRTGLVTWDAPQQQGVFNFAYKVEEYRLGIFMGYVIRDMVIFVKPCENNPPVIETISDTCIRANETLTFRYLAYDPDPLDSVYLELNNGTVGSNGPFNPDLPNPATLRGWVVDPEAPINPWNYNRLPIGTLNGDSTIEADTIYGTITWETECGNIRSSFYQVDFYAHDNFSYYGRPGISMLTAHKVVTIQVIPPPPTDLVATKESGQVSLRWNPSECTNVVGYNIYRKVGGSGFSQDTTCCDARPSDQGYKLIGYNKGRTAIAYIDDLSDVGNVLGDEICYVVTALFEDDSDGFDPNIESCGIEACAEVENNVIYLTNDSVVITDPVNGAIFLSWSKPDSIDEFFQGPFFYRLYRANNNQYPALVVADRLDFETDTTFTDTRLNTVVRGYNYRVELINDEGNVLFTSQSANVGSSIYLVTKGGDGFIDLEWTEYVPWVNTDYEIHRSENGSPFTPIATVAGTGNNSHVYRDENLSKNIEYCYFIRSNGSHFTPDIKDPLINDSQQACDYARDDKPPCTPDISSLGDCDAQAHMVTITKSNEDCADETMTITVLFSSRIEGPYMPVEVLDYAMMGQETTLTFPVTDGARTFAGCYVVTATDSFGNVSELSSPTCIDYCPQLEMSNVFSPNQDGINDLFLPKSYRDVRLVEIILFDRWGVEVHRTRNEISRLWDGIIDSNGKEASDGVYYYYIVYDELGLTENRRQEQKGWVMLLR